MEAGIQQRVVADTTASSVIASRFYPLILPEDPVLPAATYQRISTVRSYTTTGPVTLSQIRLQIDTWAKSYAEAKAAAAGIRASLECFTGALPDGTHVETITLDSSYDLYDDVDRTYRVTSDFLIFAVE